MFNLALARRYIIVLLFSAVLSYGVFSFISAWVMLKKESTRVNRRLVKLRDFKVLLNEEVRNEKELRKNLDEPDMSGMLFEFQKMAQDNGLSIERMSPDDVGKRKSRVEISLFGAEAGLMKFLTGVENILYAKIIKIFLEPDAKIQDKAHVILIAEKGFGGAVDKRGDIASIRQFLKKQNSILAQIPCEKKIFKSSKIELGRNIAFTADGYQEVLKNLNLIGIVDDGAVKAVIEDKKSGKSYFLKVADIICGLSVLQIKDNEVIFDASGAHYSLVM